MRRERRALCDLQARIAAVSRRAEAEVVPLAVAEVAEVVLLAEVVPGGGGGGGGGPPGGGGHPGGGGGGGGGPPGGGGGFTVSVAVRVVLPMPRVVLVKAMVAA